MRQSFGILFIAAVVVGFGFRTQAQNEGNALVLDVYSANIISKEIGERAFFGEAAFFGVGIGQLERAELGSQAKNQPCFSGSRNSDQLLMGHV